jgi:hypothetical protein
MLKLPFSLSNISHKALITRQYSYGMQQKSLSISPLLIKLALLNSLAEKIFEKW